MSGVAFLSLSLGAAQLFQLPQAPLSWSSARPVAQPLANRAQVQQAPFMQPIASEAAPLPPAYWAGRDVAEEYPRAPASASLVAAGAAAVALVATLLTRKAKPMVFLAVDGRDEEVELAALAVEGLSAAPKTNVQETAAQLAAKLSVAEKALNPGSQSVPAPLPGSGPELFREPARRTYQRGRPVRIFDKGLTLLNDAMFNKGTAFTESERERLGLRGLLPPKVQTVEDQYDRSIRLIHKFKDVSTGVTDDERVEYWRELTQIKARSRVLYYKVLMENFQKLCSIVYTPTIGLVCQRWTQPVFRPGLHKEMYLSMEDKGEMAALIYNYPYNDVDLVIVTDGSRVLGLGDLGVNGAGIVIGKADLYIAGAGFDPARILPVALDLGTNNEELRESPEYLGLPVEKPTGEEYYELVDEFIQAVRLRYPKALIHFEDFATPLARELLRRYRPKEFVFNDDIQGTAAVTLAGFLAYARVTGTRLEDMRIVSAGAGSASLGILDLTAKYIAKTTGKSEAEARKNFFVLKRDGLIGRDRTGISDDEIPYRADAPDKLDILETVKFAKPQIIFGCSTVSGLFTDEVLQAMDSDCPLVMPLSNPTSKAECTLEAAAKALDGKLMFCSGSPFADLEYKGKQIYANQCNNAFVFPGIGMGAVLSGASRVTDGMLLESATKLAEIIPLEEAKAGKLFPRVENIRGVTEAVTMAVARKAVEEGVCDASRNRVTWESPTAEEDLRRLLWYPEYVTYIDATWEN
jgi:malate dehydrogenase (decarboxylating)